MPRRITRRRLLNLGTAAGIAAVQPALLRAVGDEKTSARTMRGVPFEKHPVVRVGVIGVGGRGSFLMNNLMLSPAVRIVAVCDIVPEKAKSAGEAVAKKGQPTPTLYTNGDHDYENLCRRADVDLIYIATPWKWHVPMAAFAMEQGKHAAVEVPAATTLTECWKLVNTSERTRRHCVMLENCCYGEEEMTVLNIVRAGLLGELTHAACAYNHELRGTLLGDEGEGLWRREPHLTRNGNLYPTHGLGPVARYLDIDGGDRFETLVSFSSREAALSEWRDSHIAKNSPKQREKYRCGDLNISLIRTAKGRIITLEHNTVTPQPYDRINQIAGSRGVFRGYPERLYIDGIHKHDEWATLADFREKYTDPLWREVGDFARANGGHGGMDTVMNYRLIQCLTQGLVPDSDVYEAAGWSAPGPLSEWSVAHGGMPVQFPDFLRGNGKRGV